MATNSDSIMDQSIAMDSDQINSETNKNIWFIHLGIIFLIILFIQLLRLFGIVNKLHSCLVFLSSILTKSGRKDRLMRMQIKTDLKTYRSQLKTMNMTQEFAAYSKLERKIQLLERQLTKLAPETVTGSVTRQVSIHILLYAIEGILLAWSVTCSPKQTISNQIMDMARFQNSYLVPLLNLVSYIPPKLITLVWIVLCRLTVGPAVTRLSSLKQSST